MKRAAVVLLSIVGAFLAVHAPGQKADSPGWSRNVPVMPGPEDAELATLRERFVELAIDIAQQRATTMTKDQLETAVKNASLEATEVKAQARLHHAKAEIKRLLEAIVKEYPGTGAAKRAASMLGVVVEAVPPAGAMPPPSLSPYADLPADPYATSPRSPYSPPPAASLGPVRQ